MVAGLDRHEHGDAEADLLIDDGKPALDHAVGPELQALPAGCRQADALADLGHGQRRILLNDGEDLAIDGIRWQTSKV